MPNRRRGFTLVELLVVVAILALLVAILMPVLASAKIIAKRAACAMQSNGHGKAISIWVSEKGQYPWFCNGYGNDSPLYLPGFGADYGGVWPVMYGVMSVNRIAGNAKLAAPYNATGYIVNPDQVWKGALCPAMDAPAIWRWYMAQHTAGHYLNPAKGDLHRPAIGYQWNVCLRPRTQDGMRAADGTVMNTTYVHCDSGRWNRRPEQLATHANVSCTSWTDYILYPPRALYGTSGVWGYAAQAVSPDEIQGTSRVAQAWDSMDLNTAPNVDVGQTGSGAWTMENLQPGWHVGPFNRGTRGLALLNGARHLGSPNILYADGHVGRDATRVVTGADLESCPNGSWTGINVVTWPDSAPNFGTLNHIVPVLDYLN